MEHGAHGMLFLPQVNVDKGHPECSGKANRIHTDRGGTLNMSI